MSEGIDDPIMRRYRELYDRTADDSAFRIRGALEKMTSDELKQMLTNLAYSPRVNTLEAVLIFYIIEKWGEK